MATEALTHNRIAVEELVREIRRYLDAVDLFRSEGCEPAWRVEADARALDEAEGGETR